VKASLKPDWLAFREPGQPKNYEIHPYGTCISRYTYADLRDDQIRLLILYPTTISTQLVGHLTTVLLGENPKFAALSYCWGTDFKQATIYLLPPESRSMPSVSIAKEYSHPIQTNLFCALHRLRRSDECVALWVDAICIDQANPVEKTRQLSKMADIYSMAENVCVWLGESDDDGRSDSAMEFIPRIMDMAVLNKYTKDKKQAKEWAALGELMRDRWFSRRWVVQEISIAKSASLHCGSKMVQWDDFADAVSLFIANRERIRNLFDFEEWRHGPNTLGDIQSFGASVLLEATRNLFLRTEIGGIVEPVKSLESLVTGLKTFDASDPRDIVYGLISIASDTFPSLTTYQPRGGKYAKEREVKLKVDYEKLPIEVYKDFTKFCIESSGSLDIICRHWAIPVRTEHSIPKGGMGEKLPSWVPMLFDSEFGSPDEVYRGRKNGVSLVGLAGRSCYKASGDWSAVTPFREEVTVAQGCQPQAKSHAAASSDDGLCGEPVSKSRSSCSTQSDENESEANDIPKPALFLLAKGFQLASISQVSPRTTAGLILRESLQMCGWTGIENNIHSVPDKLWRTLIADRDSEGQIPPRWYQRVCLRCLELADTFSNGDLNVAQLLQEDSEMLRIYLTRVRNVTWNRKFFTSEKGDLLGLCPAAARQGDLVCVLYGCSVPVILRQHEDDGCFELIGEAYVHGKMDGEAMADVGKAQSVEFQLR